MSIQKKDVDKKNGSRSLVSAVSLTVIGAGIAAAGALFLKDKKNRNKVKTEYESAKDKVVDFVDGLKNKVEDKASTIETKLA